jgi:hypothetical protein
MYSNSLVAVNSLDETVGSGDLEPDMALCYLELQEMSFLIGECGYSDTFNLTKRRVENCIAEGQGKVYHQSNYSNFQGSYWSRAKRQNTIG